MNPHQIVQQNREAWQNLARHGHVLARPATAEELQEPLAKVDSLGWLGGDIRGWQVLCLAAGGGRHGPLYAAAGAQVTVVDFSSAMLDLDRQAIAQTGVAFQTLETSMDNLAGLADRQFDLVIHPVSTCYLANLVPVFAEVARVLKPQGLYVSQHKQPTSLQASLRPRSGGYVLERSCYSGKPLPPDAELNLIREPGTQEYIHRWEVLIGQMCRAGFVIEDLVEPSHGDPAAQEGSFGHRSQFLPPYVRIKARRTGARSSTPRLLVPD